MDNLKDDSVALGPVVALEFLDWVFDNAGLLREALERAYEKQVESKSRFWLYYNKGPYLELSLNNPEFGYSTRGAAKAALTRKFGDWQAKGWGIERVEEGVKPARIITLD
jgi:hypothetical protein